MQPSKASVHDPRACHSRIVFLTVRTLVLLFAGRLQPPPTPAIVAVAQRS
jgi:hypothetical protein